VTEKYKSLIKQRQKALYSGNLMEYRMLRNKVNRLTLQLRSAYYEANVANLSKSDSRKWWASINGFMGRKQANNAMTNLANQHTDGDETALANVINQTF
jgi:hypothetical protein